MSHMKILVLAANPQDTPQLRLDWEVRAIKAGLQRASRRDEFSVDYIWATRPTDVRRAMLEFGPHIVHFCGHGNGEAGLVFESENGSSQLVDANVLAEFFELFADLTECVVLNACYSEAQADAISRHIKHVIGMSQAIPDDVAVGFSEAFYDALGAGKSVDFAFRIATNAIKWTSLSNNLLPLLKTRQVIQHGLLIYDSQQDNGLESWTMHSSIGDHGERISITSRRQDTATVFDLRSIGGESVGINKSLRTLTGRVEFEYMVVSSHAIQPHVYFCMIPMQETGVGRSGLIEVGTDVQAHPNNRHSPFRKRWFVPMEHYSDTEWHFARIDFDFRRTPTAFYSIFAPRINEGCSSPAPAHILVACIRVYVLD